MTSTAESFWAPFEHPVGSFADFRKALARVLEKTESNTYAFAWRGVVDASWGLHSSLYRVAQGRLGHPPTESELAKYESNVMREFARWGLHNRERGRMPVLDQLATMQHYGAPTRLLDITFNAYIALFFAVERKLTGPKAVDPDTLDGRVFAIDVSKRLINQHADLASWELQHERPWSTMTSEELEDWGMSAFAWVPTPFERRIAAQQGGFLLGGVPIGYVSATKKNQWPKGKTAKSPKWDHRSVLASTCLAIRPHSFSGRGKPAYQPCYTFRIDADAKEDIRNELRALFGYEHRTLFPDYPGFATYGGLAWTK